MVYIPEMKYPVEDVGKHFREGIKSIPHIKVGIDKDPSAPDQPIFSPKEQDWINKLKKWGMIISVAAVVGYAVYRIFFG